MYASELRSDGSTALAGANALTEAPRALEALEIMVLWGGYVLHTAHHQPPRNFAIGETADCDFVIPEAKLGVARLPLIEVLAGQVSVHLPVGAKAEQATRSPRGWESAALTGVSEVALTQGTRLQIELGDLTLRLEAGSREQRVGRGGWAEDLTRVSSYFAMTLMAVGLTVGATAYSAPDTGLAEDETLDADRLYTIQQYLKSAAEREREELKNSQEGVSAEPNSATRATSAAARGEAGQMGSSRAPTSAKGRLAIKGEPSNTAVTLSRREEVALASRFGIIGMLAGSAEARNLPNVPWGELSAVGKDSVDANGRLWGDELGEGSGSNGLYLSGLGSGGGGRGDQIGIGMVGTCGVGEVCAGMRGGMANSAGHVGGGHRTKAPSVTIVNTIVTGHIPAEVIQRIVRQNFGRFRMCYERGLAQNSELQGRVAVRFVIGRDGAVSNVGDGGSDLPNGEVRSCVLSAFYGLSFPSPDAGIVTVVYPIQFSPG